MPQKTDHLYEKLTALQSRFFGQYRSQVMENRRFYDRNFKSSVVPDEWEGRLEALIPQTSRRSIDESADHILYVPKIKVPIRPTNSKRVTEREIAENKRAFLSAYWAQVSQRYNPLGDGRKPLLREGRMCIKHTLRQDALPDRASMSARQYKAAIDKLGRYDFLWCDELLDNTSVFEDPTNHRDPAYVYIQYDITVEDARALFGKELDPDNALPDPSPNPKWSWLSQNDLDTVKYTEYWSKPTFSPDGTWTEGDFIQWIEDERVSEDVNPYPYVPVAIDDAGYGDNYRGVKPVDKYVGLAQHSHDMFVAEAQQLTTWNAANGIIAFPVAKTWNMDSTRNITMGPGEIISLNGDKGQPGAEDIEFIQMPEVPRAVLALLEKTTEYANDALKINTLGGNTLPGVDTATEADQQIRNASSKLEGPLAAMERIAIKISRWVLMDIELVLMTGVTIYGTKEVDAEVVSLSPKEIKGYYDVSAEFKTSDADAISQNKARFWLEMYRTAPFLSAMTAMERGEVADDPLAEMQKRAAEDILLSPEMRQIRLMAAAQQFGKLSEMLNALQMEAAGGGDMAGVGLPTPAAPAANSGAGLMQQSTPETQMLMGGALTARDTNLGAAQLQ